MEPTDHDTNDTRHDASVGASSEASAHLPGGPPSTSPPAPATSYEVGSQVIYGLHGLCTLAGIETRSIGGSDTQLYRLSPVRPPASRSKRAEPAIWLPVESARRLGLRTPIDADGATAVMEVLSNREYYFSIQEPWAITQPLLERVIAEEGAIGLAKTLSYLTVLEKKLIIPPTEVARFGENVRRVLFREMAEALRLPLKTIEERVAKALKQKLLPDH